MKNNAYKIAKKAGKGLKKSTLALMAAGLVSLSTGCASTLRGVSEGLETSLSASRLNFLNNPTKLNARVYGSVVVVKELDNLNRSIRSEEHPAGALGGKFPQIIKGRIIYPGDMWYDESRSHLPPIRNIYGKIIYAGDPRYPYPSN